MYETFNVQKGVMVNIAPFFYVKKIYYGYSAFYSWSVSGKYLSIN